MNGAYREIGHYTDVLFRLTREDFMRPLREGVQNYLNQKAGSSSEVHIYNESSIGPPEMSHSGVVWNLKFNVGQINWDKSKRLIYGSLLLLSSDGFKTNSGMTVATVVGTNKRRRGKITIRIWNNKIERHMKYTMLESSAFFEPYKCILSQIQSAQFQRIPFQEYFIGRHGQLESEPSTVKYLRNQLPRYDLSSLMKEGYEQFGKDINILNSEWKHEEYMALNGYQLKAIKTALTKELAVIQGPPGTGKTYIALKVVKCLVDNNEYWFGRGNTVGCPILIICFTNHALDQFLEAIVEHCSIVRLGSQSKSEKLEQYSLSLLRKHWSQDRLYSRIEWQLTTFIENKNSFNQRYCTHSYYRDTARLKNRYYAQYAQLEKHIDRLSRVLTLGEKDIVSEDKFVNEGIIPATFILAIKRNLMVELGDYNYRKMEVEIKRRNTSLLREWLFCGPCRLSFDNEGNSDFEEVDDRYFMKDIDEDGKERMLDDDMDKGRRDIDMEKAVEKDLERMYTRWAMTPREKKNLQLRIQKNISKTDSEIDKVSNYAII